LPRPAALLERALENRAACNKDGRIESRLIFALTRLKPQKPPGKTPPPLPKFLGSMRYEGVALRGARPDLTVIEGTKASRAA
jgi:hypothetical protein